MIKLSLRTPYVFDSRERRAEVGNLVVFHLHYL